MVGQVTVSAAASKPVQHTCGRTFDVPQAPVYPVASALQVSSCINQIVCHLHSVHWNHSTHPTPIQVSDVTAMCSNNHRYIYCKFYGFMMRSAGEPSLNGYELRNWSETGGHTLESDCQLQGLRHCEVFYVRYQNCELLINRLMNNILFIMMVQLPYYYLIRIKNYFCTVLYYYSLQQSFFGM